MAQNNTDKMLRYWRSGSYHPDRLRQARMPPHPTLLLRRKLFDNFGTYDTSFRITVDCEAMLRWLKKGQIRLRNIPEVLIKMRIGGESNRSLDRIFRKNWEDLRAIRRHGIGGVDVLIAMNVSKLSQFRRRDRRQAIEGLK